MVAQEARSPDDLTDLTDAGLILKLLEELSSRIRASTQRIGDSTHESKEDEKLHLNEAAAPKEPKYASQAPSAVHIPNDIKKLLRPPADITVPKPSAASENGDDTQVEALPEFVQSPNETNARNGRSGDELWTPGTLDASYEARRDELLRLMDNIISVPADGRIALSPLSRNLSYLEWTHLFYKKLRECRGNFWIRDYDSINHIRHYHYRHAMCKKRAAFGGEYTSEDQSPYNTISDVYAHDKTENAFNVAPTIGSLMGEGRSFAISPRPSNPLFVAPWKRIM